MSTERHEHEREFQIQIDRVHYTVEQERMTGADLRRVPTPPVPSDRDLYQVRPGETDLVIEDGTVVTIRNGMRFFTAPRHINPGGRS